VTRSATLDLVRPLFSWVPEYDYTLGPEVGEVAAMAGLPPDPEQQLILDATFAVRGSRSAARDIGVCAPRQNLKTGSLKQMALGWLYVTEERLIVWSAHEFGTAQEAFRDMCELIESTPDLDREVHQIHRGNGDEAIELTGDRRLKFKARTKGGGRGLTGNRVVLDEAMYLKAMHMGALVPTLRAVADPQLVFAGSAGMADSHVWRSQRDRGRDGADESLAWFEWASDAEPGGCASSDCAHRVDAEGCALDDEDRLRRSNPALGRRITLETLRDDRRTMPVEEYARETLGWWDPPGEDADAAVFTEAQWLACADLESAAVGRVAFALDVAPDGQRATIGIAGVRADGLPHVAVVDSREGTDWVPARAAQLLAAHDSLPGLALDPSGPAGALLVGLEKAGVGVTQIKARELVQACQRFYNLVEAGDLRHRDEGALFDAVLGAKKRDVGDGWAWARKKATVDITPLYAATVALWAHSTGPRQLTKDELLRSAY
jgi:hypothetical protein